MIPQFVAIKRIGQRASIVFRRGKNTLKFNGYWNRNFHPISFNGIVRCDSMVSVFQQQPLITQPSNLKRLRSLSTTSLSTYDLLADSLLHGRRPKIILDAYSPTGFDVIHMIHYPSSTAKNRQEQQGDLSASSPSSVPVQSQNILHMHGSIIAFPHSCFLWNVSEPEQVNVESLSIVALYHPTIEYLFIGCDDPLPTNEYVHIQNEFKQKYNIIVQRMDVTNAMGTFNILNGEDRRVAVALILRRDSEM